jgi:hypothetical protein
VLLKPPKSVLPSWSGTTPTNHHGQIRATTYLTQ